MSTTASQLSDGTAETTNVGDASLSAGVTTSNVVDASHPFYLHPYDYPGMSLVSTVFDGRGYGGWKREVIIALSAKNKLGFTDGSIAVPTSDPVLMKAWILCNDMVLSWLLNSLSKEIAESVLYSVSAKDLWKDLEERFGQANGEKLFQLQKELNATTQGNTSVSTYFTKMKSLWDELDALNTFSACKQHSVKLTLPSIGQAYSLVVQDEKQREVHVTPVYPGESSFTATNQHNGRRFNDNRGQKSTFESKRNTLICGYCKKPGHNIDKCYKLHGFPSDFKFTKPRKFQASAQPNNAYGGIEEGGMNTTQSLSQENVTQLLQLLQQYKPDQQSENITEAFANLSFAGIKKILNTYGCFINIDSFSWILYSGATQHITYNKSILSNLKLLPKPVMVKLSNSYRVKVTHSVTITILPKLVLDNVLYVPSFKFNLLSVQKLCKQLQSYILFTPNSCLMLNGPSLRNFEEIGRVQGGLYILNSSQSSHNLLGSVYQV
ncbi:uncharacterized protein LOC132617712 [Lycium barbarum]|uniref:uncharacterized protein LOC132617712 n=1 Tax=Lycium barbarum TaxID=112863 RepID=UPI00293EC0D2|nr:uncharacterized protein LOC132617712 [Lycium barbarum]